MKYVGAHVSISGGVENAPVNAYRIGAKGFALFTKNQRQWVAAPYSAENVERFQQRCQEFGYTADQILPHDSYLLLHERRKRRTQSQGERHHRCDPHPPAYELRQK